MTELTPVLALSSARAEAVMGPHSEPLAREKGTFMQDTLERARREIRALGGAPSQLSELDRMTVDQLAERYRLLYGEPTRSRNKDYLRKRLAWRIQEVAYGGLSTRALARIEELGDTLPERWRMRAGAPQAPTEAPRVVTVPAGLPSEPRDPRIPPVGSVLRRSFQGVSHEVLVRADGFEHSGDLFKTLSAVALRITGTRWNGFLFFGLTKRGNGEEESK